MISKSAQRRHRQVRAALECKGITLSQIAAELGVSPSSVSAVSLGRSRSRTIEEAICRYLDTDVATLWPSRIEKSNK